MTKIKLLIVSTLITLTMACTSNIAKINFDKNTEIDTTSYKTFAWLTEAKIMAAPTDINPVMKVRVDKSIEEAFIAKGYTLITDAEKADFTVSYTVGSREEIKVNSYPTPYNNGWNRGYFGSRGYYGGISMGTETNVRQYTEGKLAIDVYDVKTHQPVWHGWAIKRLKSNDTETPSSKINDAVVQVVNQFN